MKILIIGVRRKCYKAALKLGHEVLLWSDGPLHESRKKKLTDTLEVPYAECARGLSREVLSFLARHEISRVIANTEETVILGARVRRALNLKTLAIDVIDRFHNKYVMKNSAKAAGIPITRYELITDTTTAEELVDSLGLPLVIKPVDESGAEGVIVARTVGKVKSLMAPGLLAEQFVEGSEISVETFIENGKPVFHNITEYLHQWKKSAIPAELTEKTRARVLELNDRVIEHFGVDRGMTHSEFYLTKNGPVFGEIAIRPPGGYYMELISKVYGFDAWEVYVKLSCGEKVGKLNQLPDGIAAVVMLHPGPGEIVSIDGETRIREYFKNLIELKIRVEPGDRVDEHTNTSNEIGHILFWEESREQMIKAIDFFEKNLTITVRPKT